MVKILFDMLTVQYSRFTKSLRYIAATRNAYKFDMLTVQYSRFTKMLPYIAAMLKKFDINSVRCLGIFKSFRRNISLDFQYI